MREPEATQIVIGPGGSDGLRHPMDLVHGIPGQVFPQVVKGELADGLGVYQLMNG